MYYLGLKLSDMRPIVPGDLTGQEYVPVIRTGDNGNYRMKLTDLPGSSGGGGGGEATSDLPHPFLFVNPISG